MKNIITVYTPTYNRAHCLTDLYDSLVRQTNCDFNWLIIDDGSSDRTEELVSEWISFSKFQIQYIKQDNEGKMAKLNFAHQILETDLCVCIDSDDFLLDNAIDLILKKWIEIKSDKTLGGIVGNAIDKNDVRIGTFLPGDLKRIKFRDFIRLGVKGDKIFAYRVDVIKSSPPYPSFEGERFPAPGYLFRLIDEHYDLSILNETLVKKDYLEDGLSKNKYEQFKKSANSFVFYRHERMRLATTISDKFRNAVHYVSSSIFAKKKIFENNNFPILTLIALPFGFLLNYYLRITNKKGVL